MRKNSQSEEHIRRIDGSNGTSGFQVHFSRGGKLWTKFFSDRKLGSKKKARLAARKYRDKLAPTLPEMQANLPMRKGAKGYSLRERKGLNGRITRYVSASVSSSDGRQIRKAFRVEKNNKADAIKTALAWRARMIRERIKAEKN